MTRRVLNCPRSISPASVCSSMRPSSGEAHGPEAVSLVQINARDSLMLDSPSDGSRVQHASPFLGPRGEGYVTHHLWAMHHTSRRWDGAYRGCHRGAARERKVRRISIIRSVQS